MIVRIGTQSDPIVTSSVLLTSGGNISNIDPTGAQYDRRGKIRGESKVARKSQNRYTARHGEPT